MLRRIKLLILIPGIALLAACASTTSVTEWYDQTYNGGQFNKLFIVGITNNNLYRRTYEDAVVKEFQQNGIAAVASYTIMENLTHYDDKSKLKQAVNKVGAEAVIVAKLIDVDKSEQYIPPSYNVMPTVGYGYYGSYHSAVSVSYQPGYVQSTTIIRINSEAFSTRDDKLIWATETESFNPSTYQKVIDELAVITYKSLQKSGFVQ